MRNHATDCTIRLVSTTERGSGAVILIPESEIEGFVWAEQVFEDAVRLWRPLGGRLLLRDGFSTVLRSVIAKLNCKELLSIASHNMNHTDPVIETRWFHAVPGKVTSTIHS